MEELNFLLESINELYGFDRSTLLSKSRKRDLVELRYVCANILKQETGYTFEYIGLILNLDHSTICYSIKVHNKLINSKNYKSYSDKFNLVLQKYNEKIQTPDKLELKLFEFKNKQKEIQAQINNIEFLLKNVKKINKKILIETS